MVELSTVIEVVWRCVLKVSGGQCVQTDLMPMMQKLCVDSWGYQKSVSQASVYSTSG